MATWTAPTTRSSGDLITTSIWNTDLVENLKYLKDAPVFTGVVTITAGTVSAPALTTSGDANTGVYFPAADTAAITTGGSERLRIDSAGRALVGTTTARTLTTLDSLVQVETAGSTYQQLSLIANRNDTGGASIILGKSRGTTVGSNTVVADGDNLGFIRFNAADGVDMDSIAAQILAQVDGAPGSNDTPGRLIFSTAADGAASVTERMRITSAGKVGIGTASPAELLHVKGVADAYLRIDSTGASKEAVLQLADDGTLKWAVYKLTNNSFGIYDVSAAAQRLGITTSGHLAIGATAKLYLDGVAGTGDTYIQEGASNRFDIVCGGNATIKVDPVGMYSGAWPTTASAANAYVADNDYIKRSTSSIRYKHDVQTLDAMHAASAVMAMRPVTYRGKTDEDQRQFAGFIAEEMAEIAPLLCTYDDGGESGTPNYVTYDRVTAYLVAVVQQQQTEIAALKARLN